MAYSSVADYRTYKVGDPVLVYLANHDGEMTEGRVIHIFTHGGLRLYVIAIETPMDDVYEVRSGHILGLRPSRGSMEYDSWQFSSNAAQQRSTEEKP
jgi:hypothetical protein